MKGGQFYKLTSNYESTDKFTARCWTIIYSFGKSVIDKKQVAEPIESPTGGSYHYNFDHKPMCEYLEYFLDEIQTIHSDEDKAKVLSNLTALQASDRRLLVGKTS